MVGEWRAHIIRSQRLVELAASVRARLIPQHLLKSARAGDSDYVKTAAAMSVEVEFFGRLQRGCGSDR